MTSNTRPTVASLAAAQERTDNAIATITSLLGSVIEHLDVLSAGQPNTTATVVTAITDAPSTKAKASKASKKAKPAKTAMPAQLREGFAVVRETKDAMSPLNKALARLFPGEWIKAHLRPAAQVKAALDTLTPAERKAAKAALDIRLTAAAKRA